MSNFTDTDTGTYRVLDYEGETWIIVTVTESSPESDSERRRMISEPAKSTTEPKGDNSTNNTTSDPKQQRTHTEHVSETKGGNITLSCAFEDREITHIRLFHRSEKILVCENEKCKSENGRVFKERSCDVILTDLRYRDAGKYILRVRYTNDQSEVKPLEYHLHIHDEISVKKGEDLKLDVLLINADKVEHQHRTRADWEKIWTRDDGVNGDRLTVSDETLIINDFNVTDTGTYRVLDSNNQILITVTVTESGSTGKHKASHHPDRKLLSWPEKVNGIFVITIFIAYIVIMAVQIVLRFAGRF